MGVVGVGQDITEKKVAEFQLVRAADDLRKLIDTVNVPIFGIDTKSCVNEWNQKAAEILGVCLGVRGPECCLGPGTKHHFLKLAVAIYGTGGGGGGGGG